MHSALSNLGYVIGAAQSVLEALLETVEDGTIVMPAHTGDNADPAKFKNPPLPEKWHASYKEHYPAFDKETSHLRGMGRIAVQFFAMKDTLRSDHPTVSFTARGALAETITASQPLSPMFGRESPIGRIYEHGGRILLLGASFASCSAFHLSEIMSGVVGRTREQAAIKENGVRRWVTYEDYAYDEADFEEVGNQLPSENVTSSPAGPGEVRLMDARTVIDEAAKIIRGLRTA